MPNNLIIYGGSFDPLHFGHLKTALNVQSKFHFQRFLFLPCKTSVLKRPTIASTEQRIKMLELALKAYPGLSIDLREINRNTPSYMVDTLENFREELGVDITITLLIGFDAFAQLNKWHRWDEILSLCNLLVMKRATIDESTIPPILVRLLKAHQTSDVNQFLFSPHGKIFKYDAGNYDISSTWLREQLKQDNDVAAYMPNNVYNYIKEQHLYCK